MRLLIALLVIVYLVGVGVALSPTIKEKWNSAPASDLSASVVQALPDALAWPARVFRSLTGRG
jgi:Flp pilus assembly pilin Flp